MHQAASEKREAMEKKLRAKLEEEVRELREEGSAAHTSATAQDQQDFDTLLRKLSHAEEKVPVPVSIHLLGRVG